MRDGEKFRLGDLCSITKGQTPIRQAVPGSYPLVVTAQKRASHETFQFDCSAVIVPLVSSTGHGHASIKRIHYQEGKFALGSILCAVVPKDEKCLHPQFLHIYFSYFKDQLIVPLMKGTANVSLSIKALSNLKIIAPSMEVQMRVIELAKNDALMKPLEDEIAHQEALLGKLKQAILQEAIQGKLTEDWRAANPDTDPAAELLKRIQKEKAKLIADKKLRKEKPLPPITPEEIPFEIPEGWALSWLRDVSCIRGGITKNSAKRDGHKLSLPYLRVANVYANRLELNEIKEIGLAESEVERYLLQSGDLLVVEGNGSKDQVGRIAVWDGSISPCLHQNHLINVRLLDKALVKWVLLFYLSPLGRAVLEDQARTSTGLYNLSTGKIAGLPFLIPPSEEQAAIVERVEALMESCRALEKEIELSRTHAAHLLQAVLKEAFSQTPHQEFAEQNRGSN